jgi:hypothetical protein
MKKSFLKFFRNIKLPKIKIDKRQRIASVAVLLSIGLVMVQLVDVDYRYLGITILAIIAYFLSAIALWEDLSGVEWVTLLLLPSIYTLAVGLFYFLVPVRWATRLPAVAFYGIGLYAILLTENIFNVASQRTIGLVRAAASVGFLMTLLTLFLLFDTILAFKQSPLINFILCLIISFPLSLSFLWSVKLEEWISKEILLYSLITSLVVAEMAMVVSFWPLTTIMAALFIMTVAYVVLALGQFHMVGKLVSRMVWELVVVSGTVVFMMFLSARWGG